MNSSKSFESNELDFEYFDLIKDVGVGRIVGIELDVIDPPVDVDCVKPSIDEPRAVGTPLPTCKVRGLNLAAGICAPSTLNDEHSAGIQHLTFVAFFGFGIESVRDTDRHSTADGVDIILRLRDNGAAEVQGRWRCIREANIPESVDSNVDSLFTIQSIWQNWKISPAKLRLNGIQNKKKVEN